MFFHLYWEKNFGFFLLTLYIYIETTCKIIENAILLQILVLQLQNSLILLQEIF